MNWFEVDAAISEARRTLNAADNHAQSMAKLLKGRLRHVSCRTLADLKKELRDFNSHTGKWKEEA